MLAAEVPTLMQRLLFGGEPGLLAGLIWSLALVLFVFLAFMSLFAMFAIWWERKVAGHMQSRPGPNRVGPMGLLQSVADGAKLFMKEDLRPDCADSILFRLAPYLAFVPAFVAFLAIPFGPDWTFEPRLSSGLFWLLAILSIEIMGVILAGWASASKWAIFGAMREACQMVSYEIPMGISVIVAVMAAGTLNMVELGSLQSGGVHTWIMFRSPFAFAAFFIFFVASLASNKRAPFDLPESESELVAGFHTEYSGLRFGMFFFGEYGAMFIVAAIQVAVFLGGWNDPFGIIGYLHAKYSAAGDDLALLAVNMVAAGIFIGKSLIMVFVQMWLRWTLPRPRIDQVLYACVKVLLPASCALLLGGAIWPLIVPDLRVFPWVNGFHPWSASDWIDAGGLSALITQGLLAIIGVSLFGAMVAWVLHAWIHRNDMQARIAHPEPILEERG